MNMMIVQYCGITDSVTVPLELQQYFFFPRCSETRARVLMPPSGYKIFSWFESVNQLLMCAFVYNLRRIKVERESCRRNGPHFWKLNSCVRYPMMVFLLTSFRMYMCFQPNARKTHSSMQCSLLNGELKNPEGHRKIMFLFFYYTNTIY